MSEKLIMRKANQAIFLKRRLCRAYKQTVWNLVFSYINISLPDFHWRTRSCLSSLLHELHYLVTMTLCQAWVKWHSQAKRYSYHQRSHKLLRKDKKIRISLLKFKTKMIPFQLPAYFITSSNWKLGTFHPLFFILFVLFVAEVVLVLKISFKEL